jgi:hypothetical protein
VYADAHPRLDLGPVICDVTPLANGFNDVPGGSDCAQWIVLAGDRIAKTDHDAVAQALRDVTVITVYNPFTPIVICFEKEPILLFADLLSDAYRVHQIAEDDGDRPALESGTRGQGVPYQGRTAS